MPASAVILAAGRGTRLAGDAADASAYSKPLFRVGSRTLLEHAMNRCADAGLDDIVVVTGFAADQVRAQLQRWSRTRVREIYNERWDLPNGLSLSACRGALAGEFVLLMADHLFDGTILRDLVALPSGPGATLAIDRRLDQVFDLDDATKVEIAGDRIVAIGKSLASYNAVDCGLFRCSEQVFDALTAAQAAGRRSLSNGMQELARAGSLRPMDIGDRWWQDVDTPEMAAQAARLLAAHDGSA